MNNLKPLYFFLLILICLVGCRPDSLFSVKEEWSISCGAEDFDEEQFLWSNPFVKSGDLRTRSGDTCFSGQYAVRLNKENRYGFSLIVRNVRPNDKFEVKVKRKGDGDKGILVVQSKDPKNFYEKAVTGEKVNDDWSELRCRVVIPPNFKGTKLKIYTWNPDGQEVYFDDMVVTKHIEWPERVGKAPEGIHFYLTDMAHKKLVLKRAEAFENGILETNDDDWVKAIYFDENDDFLCKLRLKGDWLDHLKTDKWSFRIKLKKGTWNGVEEFSIQNPATRGWLNEWFLHELCEKEDILTTTYDFINVSINGEHKGIYAWEEHFLKQLLEKRSRREGPIIRFEEEGFWSLIKTEQQEKPMLLPYYVGAVIKPYGAKDLKKSPDKKLQFIAAQDLLDAFRDQTLPLDEIFDVDKLARFYALLDLTHAYHGFTWHNVRYYYNPVINRLEPIYFDGGIDDTEPRDMRRSIFGDVNASMLKNKPIKEQMLYTPFLHDEFVDKYILYLKRYAGGEYLKNSLEEFKTGLDSLTLRLQQDRKHYQLNIPYFYENVDLIRKNLSDYEKRVRKGGFYDFLKTQVWRLNHADTVRNMDVCSKFVHIYKDKKGDKFTYQVENFSGVDVKIIDGRAEGILHVDDGISRVINRYKDNQAGKFTFDSGNDYKVFQVELSKDEIMSIPVYNWPAPKNINRAKKNIADISTFGKIKGDTLIVTGNVIVDRTVIIPADVVVKVEAGTNIDIVNHASVISYASLVMTGTKEHPIHVTSSDHTAEGFNVLQANSRSSLRHVVFDGLSNLHKGGWMTPAAVCFYEADVDMYHVTFKRNVQCDDGLNIVRSDFKVESCVFEACFADAFDSDFCTGLVTDCQFIRPGNDAIDFSGSDVVIENCLIRDAGDKGISGGEESHLIVRNTEVSGANIGIASKDLSRIEVDKARIEDVTYGLVAFQKKSEYGPAKLHVNNLKMKKYLFMHLIEENSMLYLNGKEIFGIEHRVAERFY
ncbi:hypothetical protein EYV94_22245 [Puteibacter caeruleilacunae]|nr:hypothetical protein EYV94_22245 [Puteibacter caeruleilacunae]